MYLSKSTRIVILKGSSKNPLNIPLGTTIISFEQLKNCVKKGVLLKHLFRYKESFLRVYRIEIINNPFLSFLLIRLLSLRNCFVEDETGKKRKITILLLIKSFVKLLADFLKKKTFIKKLSSEILNLEKSNAYIELKGLNLEFRPAYLRTDLWFGVHAGGSVGHIAGVLNNLNKFSGEPIFITTDLIPSVEKNIESHIILPNSSFWDFKELPSLHFNELFYNQAKVILTNYKLTFIYQRYGLNNFCGLKLAKDFKIPFVLEYNGSEIWVNRHWGKPLKYEFISKKIEILNLKSADLIVVVSQKLKEDLVGLAIKSDKILVNPNGVNINRYYPDIDGTTTKNLYNLEQDIVIGFISTFGKWHGADVLAEAFACLLKEFPKYHKKVKLLMIGDGPTLPFAKQKLFELKVSDHATFTGLIPQEEGPKYLAACDILVSPQIPNPDGSPFFGSPTKIFEYMAMGKGIVASDLDQIGEVLTHNETAWLVKPGDSESLMFGLKALIEDEALRKRLGEAARKEVVAKYTWKEHVRKIIEKLKERCS